MIAIVLIISATLVSSLAQYSNVRYQPENTQDSYADKKYYDQQQDLSNYYRVPEVDALQTFGIPADSYEVPSYIYIGTFNLEAQQKNNDDANNAATEYNPEGNKKDRKDDKASEIEVEKVEGAYYVLLPSSQLQRVQFMTDNDRQNMAYTARLSYRSESAPIFVYMPQQYQQPAAAHVINGVKVFSVWNISIFHVFGSLVYNNGNFIKISNSRLRDRALLVHSQLPLPPLRLRAARGHAHETPLFIRPGGLRPRRVLQLHQHCRQSHQDVEYYLAGEERHCCWFSKLKFSLTLHMVWLTLGLASALYGRHLFGLYLTVLPFTAAGVALQVSDIYIVTTYLMDIPYTSTEESIINYIGAGEDYLGELPPALSADDTDTSWVPLLFAYMSSRAVVLWIINYWLVLDNFTEGLAAHRAIKKAAMKPKRRRRERQYR